MSELISMEDNRALEDKLAILLKTKNFMVFYTLEEEGEPHQTGLVQGVMSLSDISLYNNILNYMASSGVASMYDGDID
jgi:hypothetical protein